jgi:hypothetical protein
VALTLSPSRTVVDWLHAGGMRRCDGEIAMVLADWLWLLKVEKWKDIDTRFG